MLLRPLSYYPLELHFFSFYFEPILTKFWSQITVFFFFENSAWAMKASPLVQIALYGENVLHSFYCSEHTRILLLFIFKFSESAQKYNSVLSPCIKFLISNFFQIKKSLNNIIRSLKIYIYFRSFRSSGVEVVESIVFVSRNFQVFAAFSSALKCF